MKKPSPQVTNGVHAYYGYSNSRGKRNLSKLHAGLRSGDVARAFREVEELQGREHGKRKEVA